MSTPQLSRAQAAQIISICKSYRDAELMCNGERCSDRTGYRITYIRKILWECMRDTLAVFDITPSCGQDTVGFPFEKFVDNVLGIIKTELKVDASRLDSVVKIKERFDYETA